MKSKTVGGTVVLSLFVVCLMLLCVFPGRMLAETESENEPRAAISLPGYENTKRGVTGPDGRAMSGYTWEMYYENQLERAKSGIKVIIDGTQIDFPDGKPTVVDGRVLVPLRPVFESANVQCRVSWDEGRREAAILDQRGRKTVIGIGDAYYTVIYPEGGEKTYPLDVPASIIEGRVMLPLRAILEDFQYRVTWFEESKTIDVMNRHPGWRKLLPADEWAAVLKDGCVPCIKAGETQ